MLLSYVTELHATQNNFFLHFFHFSIFLEFISNHKKNIDGFNLSGDSDRQSNELRNSTHTIFNWDLFRLTLECFLTSRVVA